MRGSSAADDKGVEKHECDDKDAWQSMSDEKGLLPAEDKEVALHRVYADSGVTVPPRGGLAHCRDLLPLQRHGTH